MAEDPKTSDEDWSNFEDSEDQGSVSDESNSGSNDDEDDLTDRQSDDENVDKQHGQSDTETRNLLDDADFEEDILLEDEMAITTSRLRNDDLDNKNFSITPEQQNYYDQLFLHLQYLSTGEANLDGALNGEDAKIVEFFKKSRLDTNILGKIWDLADINVDGKLNRFEFSVATHLIVLHKKGNYPIPDHLPTFFDLRITPQRIDESPRSTEGTSIVDSQNSATSFGNGLIIDETDGAVKKQSLSDDKIHSLQEKTIFNPITEFGKDPPLCVDRVPQPVRSNHGSNTQLTAHPLNPTGLPYFPTTLPKGPPPEPPLRSYQKGHGRSASLDLNTRPPVFVDFRNNPGTSVVSDGLNPNVFSTDETKRFGIPDQRCFTLPAGSIPPTSCKLELQKLDKIVSDTLDVFNSHAKKSDESINSKNNQQQIIQPKLLPIKPDYHSRCTVLRQVNAELESKLATLSQIRLQLKLRVEEVQGKSNGPNLQLK